MIELGIKVKDKITGFEGVVTGYVEYLSGCNQALVAPRVKEDGSLIDSEWIDEQRLDRVGKTQITLDNGAHPGADTPAPKR